MEILVQVLIEGCVAQWKRRKIKQDEQSSGKNTRKARKRGKILIENEYHTLLDSNMNS